MPSNVRSDRGNDQNSSGAGEYDSTWIYLFDVRDGGEYDVLWVNRNTLWVWAYRSRNGDVDGYKARLADFLSRKKLSSDDNVILGDTAIVEVRTTDPKVVNPLLDGRYVLGMGTKGLLRLQCGSRGQESGSSYVTSVVYFLANSVTDSGPVRQTGVAGSVGGALNGLIDAMPAYAEKLVYAYVL